MLPTVLAASAVADSAWTPETIGALIAALAALVVATVNFLAKRSTDASLARLENQLSEAHERSKARLDYEYEARKRLYAEFQPLLFQFVELSDDAYWRIVGLARSASQNRLCPDGSGRLASRSSDYFTSTIYRLMAPLVLYRLFQSRLTIVDLSLDSNVQNLYFIAKVLHRSWNAGIEIAKINPRIDYDPYESDGSLPRQPRQHINLRRIDELVAAMTIPDGKSGSLRCATYLEFLRGPGNEKSAGNEKLAGYRAAREIGELFRGFHPLTRPVLWRTLVAQACLFRAGMDAFTHGLAKPLDSRPDDERAEFDWRTDDQRSADSPTSSEAVDEPFIAARTFLEARLSRLNQVDSSQADTPGAPERAGRRLLEHLRSSGGREHGDDPAHEANRRPPNRNASHP